MRIIPKLLAGWETISLLPHLWEIAEDLWNPGYDQVLYSDFYDPLKGIGLGFIGYGGEGRIKNGRYKPSGKNEYAIKILENKDYIDYTNSLINKDNTLTDEGIRFARWYDSQLPADSNRRFFIKNDDDDTELLRSSWAIEGKNLVGKPNTFKTPGEYMKFIREDNLLGPAHNMASKEVTRYYYINENGLKVLIPEFRANLYTDKASPEETFDGNTIYTDIEVANNNDINEMKKLITGEDFDKKLEERFDAIDKQYSIPTRNPKPNKFKEFLSKLGKGSLDPRALGAMRVAYDNAYNWRAMEDYNKHLNAPFLNYTPIGRQIHGDYIAQQEGLNLAARLRIPQPISANAQVQSAADLEGITKGNQFVREGDYKDAQTFWNTSDLAWLQGEKNVKGLLDVANTNAQLAAKYEEARGKNEYNTKLMNAQNWDRWAAMWEDRDLAESDYYRDRNRKRIEAFEQAVANINPPDPDFDAAYMKYYRVMMDPKSTDVDRQNAKLEYENVAKKKQLEQLRRQGKVWGFDDNTINGVINNYTILGKNGGILRKLQQGGGFPGGIAWTPLMQEPYKIRYSALASTLGTGSESSSSSKSSRSSSSSDSDSKERNTLLKSIAESIKGVDGLTSDMSIISQSLMQLFDMNRYLPEDMDPNILYSGYVLALGRISAAKRSAKNYEDAKQHLESIHAMDSYAISGDGRVYVGKVGTKEIALVTPQEALAILNDPDSEFEVLTNADVLEYRDRVAPFRDDLLLGVALSGVSMEQITEYMNKVIGKLGSDKESQDYLAKNYSPGVAKGMLVLASLRSRLNDLDYNSLLRSLGAQESDWMRVLIEANIATEEQLIQAQSAVNVVALSLSKPMKTLLYLNTGGKSGNFISDMVTKGTSSERKIDISDITALDEQGNPTHSTRTGKGSNGSSGEDAESRFLMNIQKGMGGSESSFTLNPGTKSTLAVSSIDYNPVEASEPSSLRVALVNSKIWGIGYNSNKSIYFGDLKIPVENLDDIVYTGSGFSRVILPKNPDGGPRLDLIPDFEKLCDDLRLKGIDPVKVMNGEETDEAKVKQFMEAMKDAEFLQYIPGQEPDLSKLGVFLVADGYASEKIKDLKESPYVVEEEDPDYDKLNRILSTKGLDNKVIEYDLSSGWFSKDKVFKGTIYIPIALNPEMAAVAEGNKQKPHVAMQYELENQAFNNLLRHKKAVDTAVLEK